MCEKQHITSLIVSLPQTYWLSDARRTFPSLHKQKFYLFLEASRASCQSLKNIPSYMIICVKRSLVLHLLWAYLRHFGSMMLLEPSLSFLVCVMLLTGVIVCEIGICCWLLSSCCCSGCRSCCCRSCCGSRWCCGRSLLLWEMDRNLNIAKFLHNKIMKN